MTSTQVNLFLPQQRLISKVRTGAIVRKKHDTASTPLNRILDQHPGLLDPHDLEHLHVMRLETDVIALRHQIADIQGNLIELARRRGAIQPRAKTNATYLNRRKMTPTTRAPSDESTTHNTRAS